MFTFQDAAHSVSSNLSSSDSEVQAIKGDGTFINILVSLLPTLLTLFNNCQTPAAQVSQISKQKRAIHVVLARMKVRQELGGPRAFRQAGGENLIDALFKTGAELKAEQVEDLYQQI